MAISVSGSLFIHLMTGFVTSATNDQSGVAADTPAPSPAKPSPLAALTNSSPIYTNLPGNWLVAQLDGHAVLVRQQGQVSSIWTDSDGTCIHALQKQCGIAPSSNFTGSDCAVDFAYLGTPQTYSNG